MDAHHAPAMQSKSNRQSLHCLSNLFGAHNCSEWNPQFEMLFIVFARRQRCARPSSLRHQEIHTPVFAFGTFDPGTVSSQSIGVVQGRSKVCFQLSYRYGRFVLDRSIQFSATS
jgi:hypothetical protein